MRVLFVLFCFTCFQNIYAKDYPYINYTVEDGLPSSQVYNVVQDNNGYLWFSTDHGISRYDGYEFENFDVNDGLPDNVVLRLFPQLDNEIWGATVNGELFYFNTKDYRITPYKFNEQLKKVVGDWSINSFFIDEDQSLYIAFYYASGYLKVDSAGNFYNHMRTPKRTGSYEVLYSYYLVNAIKKQSLDSLGFSFTTFEDPNLLYSQLPDFDLEIFKSSKKYNVKYNRCLLKSKRWNDKVIYTDVNSFNYKDVNNYWSKKTNRQPLNAGFYEDNTLWVSFIDGGMNIYSLEGELIKSYLVGKPVTDMLIDRQGGMWLTTLNEGVFYTSNTSFKEREISNNAGMITSIFNVQNETTYIQYSSGKAYKYYNGKVSQVLPENVMGHSLHLLYTKYNNKITKYQAGSGIIVVDDDRVIIPKGKDGVILKIITNDSYKDVMFVGHFGFGILNKEGKYQWYDVGKIVVSVRQFMGGWYVATNDGLYYYTDKGEFLPLSSKDLLFSSPIKDLSGNLKYTIATTQGRGLLVFNDDTVFNITTKNGLTSNMLERIYKENDSLYWVCSNSGLNCIKFKSIDDYSIIRIDQSDGLLSNEIRDVAVVKDSIWVVTSKGVNILPLSYLDEKPVKDLYLRIKNITINDSSITSEELGYLNYQQNSLKVEFTAISFHRNKELEYRYQIQGLEDQWNHTTSRTANYPSLPPGTYNFIVEVSDGRSGFNEQASFEFTILKPYYATWWFKTILVLTITALVYLFFRVRILTYNKDIIRELLRHFLKWIRRNQKYIIIKSQGKNVKLITSDIYYIKSSGNYIEVYTTNSMHLVRAKIGEFIEELPDQIEFLRVHRSYIIRLDKVEQHDSNTVVVKGEKIPIGNRYKTTYLKSVF